MNTCAKESWRRLTDLTGKISENPAEEAESAMYMHQRIKAGEWVPGKAEKSDEHDDMQRCW